MAQITFKVPTGNMPATKWNIRMMPLSELQVDRENYQRPLDEKRVEKIIAEFDPIAFGTLFVNERREAPYAGKYYVFDGQHRLVAARRMALNGGPTEVLCVVTEGLTIEEEAGRYVTMDTERRSLQSMDRFRARVVNQDPDALRVLRLIEKSGFSIDTSVSWRNAKSGYVRAVDAVEVAIKRYGENATLAGMRTLHAVWPDDQIAVQRNFILGVCRLIFKMGDKIRARQLDKKLAYITPRDVIHKAQGLRDNLSSRADDSIGHAMWLQYVKGMRDDTKAVMPTWESRVIRPRSGGGGAMDLLKLSEQQTTPVVVMEELDDERVDPDEIRAEVERGNAEEARSDPVSKQEIPEPTINETTTEGDDKPNRFDEEIRRQVQES